MLRHLPLTTFTSCHLVICEVILLLRMTARPIIARILAQIIFNKKSSFILIMSNENRIKKDKSYIFCSEGAYWASIAQGGNRDLILSSRRLRFYSTDFPSGLWEATTLILFKHGGGSPDGQCRYILIIVFIFVNQWIHQIISWAYSI